MLKKYFSSLCFSGLTIVGGYGVYCLVADHQIFSFLRRDSENIKLINNSQDKDVSKNKNITYTNVSSGITIVKANSDNIISSSSASKSITQTSHGVASGIVVTNPKK